MDTLPLLKLVLTTLVASGALVVIGVSPAYGCVCQPITAIEEAVASWDGAFVGVFTGRDVSVRDQRMIVNHFDVERVVKGPIGRQIDVESGGYSSCGLEMSAGERIGLLLRQVDGIWRSGACAQVDPALLAGASAKPEMSGDAASEIAAPGSGEKVPRWAWVAFLGLVVAAPLAIRRALRRRQREALGPSPC